MTFTPQQARLITTGLKTQHRIPIPSDLPDPQPSDCPMREGKPHTAMKPRERTDNELVDFTSRGVKNGRVRRRRKRTIAKFARLDVDAVTIQTLGDVAYLDARAEGFKTTADFLAAWEEQHGSAEPDQRIWAVTFRLIREDLDDTPRMLHKDSSHGYTRDRRLALVDEPEAVSASDQAWITGRSGLAQEQWATLEAARRDQVALDLRLRAVLEDADPNDGETRRLIARIREAVQQAEAKARREAA